MSRPWRVARSLDVLLAEVNASAPHRSTLSDGSIGNAEHAARDSDHNPWIVLGSQGIVTARDYTHDPAGGLDAYALAEWLLRLQDPRLKYVISNRRIGSGPAGPSPGRWRPYDGKNAHQHHTHVSVSTAPRLFDSTQAWGWARTPAATGPRLLELQTPPMRGEDVAQLQRLLGINADGVYGPVTDAAVRGAQARRGLPVDGVVGPVTLGALRAPQSVPAPLPPSPPPVQEDDMATLITVLPDDKQQGSQYLSVGGAITPLDPADKPGNFPADKVCPLILSAGTVSRMLLAQGTPAELVTRLLGPVSA